VCLTDRLLCALLLLLLLPLLQLLPHDEDNKDDDKLLLLDEEERRDEMKALLLPLLLLLLKARCGKHNPAAADVRVPCRKACVKVPLSRKARLSDKRGKGVGMDWLLVCRTPKG